MAIVAVSRGTFAGGTELAECVAARLGYQCLSREELVKKAAQEYGAPEYGLTAALDNKPGFLEGLSPRRVHYIAFVRATLVKKIRQDNVVYHGQVGHLLLQGLPNVFSVRVVADMEYRVRVAMEQHHLERAQAVDFVKKADLNRAKWAKTIYHVDWEDPSLYDLLIDLGTTSVTDACNQVASAVRASPKATSDFSKALDDLLLGTDVRARIAAHRAIEDGEIDIEADGDVIIIKGIADSDGEASWITQVVAQTPGVREIVSEMHVRSSGIYASR